MPSDLKYYTAVTKGSSAVGSIKGTIGSAIVEGSKDQKLVAPMLYANTTFSASVRNVKVRVF